MDPKEALKERQKTLNAERKSPNRLTKVKHSMEKKETKSKSWKDKVTKGLKQEEERCGEALLQELKAQERQRDSRDQGNQFQE